MRILNILWSGYRATLEEQDDTIVWLTHMLKTAGAEVDILLRGATANYIVEGQAASPLTFGERTQRHAPDVHGQVRELAARGVGLYVEQSDIERRGLAASPLLGDISVLEPEQLPALLSRYDQVWHW